MSLLAAGREDRQAPARHGTHRRNDYHKPHKAVCKHGRARGNHLVCGETACSRACFSQVWFGIILSTRRNDAALAGGRKAAGRLRYVYSIQMIGHARSKLWVLH
jgi:hypothetical protein